MRDVLARLSGRAPSHVGLAYDVWAPVGHGDGKVSDRDRPRWLERVRAIEIDRDYPKAYERWKDSVREDGVCRLVETQSRLLVGHGNPSGSDVGLTVQHTWGVPMIPGSALAGVLASYVHAELGGGEREREQEPERARWLGPRYDDERGVVVGAPGEHYRCLFGAPEIAGDRRRGIESSPGAAGTVVFCDALYVPGSGGVKGPFEEDVLTVHHKGYYGDNGAVPPTDYDDPTPVSFLGVGKGVRFLLALCGPAEWTTVAMKLLIDALAWRGVGGKTAAGYGRLRAVAASEAAVRGVERAAERAAAASKPVRVAAGPELAAFRAWLDELKARGTRVREVIPAIEREWVGRLVRLGVEERLEAGRWIRKAIKRKDLEEAAKALSRRIEAGED